MLEPRSRKIPMASWWLRWYSVCLQCSRPGFNSWVRKILWRRVWQPTPVFLPGKFHGLRNLVGYSPWGHKGSDMTDPLQCTSLDQEDPTCHGATKPVHRNSWARALEPGSRSYWSLCTLGSMLCRKRGHGSEMPTHCNLNGSCPLQLVKVCTATKSQRSQQ